MLSACAVASKQQGETPAPAPQPPAARAQSGDAAADPATDASQTDEKLPNVKLTPTLMYQLMKAELDYKKGDWQGPYLTMLSLAQQTKDPRLAQRAAEMALSAKQPDDALAAVRLWRQLAPDSEEASQYYLGLVVISDNIAEAEPIFRQRLAQADSTIRPLLLFQMQQLLMRAKDKEAGNAMLERLVEPYRNTMEGHVVLAQAAQARGARDVALREANAALAMKPDSEIAVLTLAQVTEDEAKIVDLLGNFLASHPKAREVRAARARVLVNQKQFEAARKEFLVLLADQPNNAGTLYALGLLSLQMNDSPAAEKYLSHFVDVLGDNPDDERDPSKALLILSQIAEDRRDYSAALGWLDKIPDDDSKVAFGTQLRRAQLMGKQGDVEAARKLLATLKPEDVADQAQVAVTEAMVLRDAGRIEDAYRQMAAAAKRFPANTDLLYDFALMAEKAGHLDVMETTLRKVMAQAPDNHHAYNALGYSLAERNVRLQEAFQLIDKALKMAPGDPFIMDSMGWVQYRLGNLNEAELLLRRAYALRSDPEIAVHLGEVLWKKGQKAAAQQLWHEAHAKDPQNDALRETLARLHLSL
ncbi:tetratricopeptide repeat protein [Massilia horti]